MPALQEFRPELWAPNLIVDTDKALVFGNVANRNYEGEISGYGSVIKVNEIGDVSEGAYTEGSDISVPELTGAQKEMTIDQKRYSAFKVDDVLSAQARGNIREAGTQKMGYSMADTVDQFIAALYTEAGVTDSDLGSSGSSETVYATGATLPLVEMITNWHRYLDESDAPSMGRWAVIPPWFHQYLKYAQIVDDSTNGMKTPDSQAVGNGFIGSGLGFTWYASNNVSNNGTQYRVMFGTEDAISFAMQVMKMEAFRMELQFADLVRVLWVYGAKVIRPDHLGTAYLEAGGLTT